MHERAAPAGSKRSLEGSRGDWRSGRLPGANQQRICDMAAGYSVVCQGCVRGVSGVCQGCVRGVSVMEKTISRRTF
jgi:hypothetical protein